MWPYPCTRSSTVWFGESLAQHMLTVFAPNGSSTSGIKWLFESTYHLCWMPPVASCILSVAHDWHKQFNVSLLQALERFMDAFTSFETALSLDPKNVQAKSALQLCEVQIQRQRRSQNQWHMSMLCNVANWTILFQTLESRSWVSMALVWNGESWHPNSFHKHQTMLHPFCITFHVATAYEEAKAPWLKGARLWNDRLPFRGGPNVYLFNMLECAQVLRHVIIYRPNLPTSDCLWNNISCLFRMDLYTSAGYHPMGWKNTFAFDRTLYHFGRYIDVQGIRLLQWNLVRWDSVKVASCPFGKGLRYTWNSG